MSVNANAALIVGGPAKLYHTAVSDANYLGSTTGGIKRDFNQTVNEKRCDQVSGAIGFIEGEMTAKVTGTFAETTGLDAIEGGGGLGIGLNDVQVFVAVGEGPSGTERTTTFHKGLLVKTSEVENKLGGQSGYPFTIMLAVDLTKPEGEEYYSHVDA